MNYIQFQKTFAPWTVFSLADIRQAEPSFDRRRLSEWQGKGYIRKIIKGYYTFCDKSPDEKTLFEIANRLYAPSYISFEMALSFYGLIPESVYGITSASTRKTSAFNTELGSFIYRSIRPKLYFGFDLLENKGRFFKIASPEKALLDLFYIKKTINDEDSFEELRVNKDIFLKVINRSKMNRYVDVFGQRTLKRRMRKFWEYIKDA